MPLPTRAVMLRDGNILISDQAIEVNPGMQIVFAQGKIQTDGNGFNQLNAPYDAKVIGGYTGLTRPFGFLVGSTTKWWARFCGYGIASRSRRLARRTRAMHDLLGRQAKAAVQPWAGMWDTGHGEAWQADTDRIQAHETVWAAVPLG